MILVVDDTKEIVDWLVETVQSAGYYCDFAMDSNVALYKMERIYYAMALIDIILPHGMNGIELARRVRDLPEPFCHIPLVGMTGGSIEPEGGVFAAVLRKPVLPKDVREVIASYAAPPIQELRMEYQQPRDLP